MALIGQLTVGIVANTQKAVAGVGKFRRQMNLTARSAKAATLPISRFATAITGIGIGLSAAGVASVFRSTAESIDKIGKTSSKLGIATENLIGLQHAASQTGVSTDTLNMAMQRMVRRVAEAAQGTGEAVKALKELNLDAQLLNSLSPDRQMEKIADAMKGVKNQSDRVRLAMKLFDSEGVSLVNTLALGSKGLQQMQKDAEQLGIVFSGEEAKRVEKFNDELDRLKKSLGSFGQKLVIDIAPQALQAIQNLQSIQSTMRGESGSVGAGNAPGTDFFQRNFPMFTRMGEALERSIFDSGSTARSLAGGAQFSQNVSGGRRAELLSDQEADKLAEINKQALAKDRAAESLLGIGKRFGGRLSNVAKANAQLLAKAGQEISESASIFSAEFQRQGLRHGIGLHRDPKAAQSVRELFGQKPDEGPRGVNAALERGSSSAAAALHANFRKGETTQKAILSELKVQTKELQKKQKEQEHRIPD